MRKLIYAFWIFIAIMLLWQFYTYNQGMNQQATDHPTQDHYYFFDTNAGQAAAPTLVQHASAFVEQTSFSVKTDTPARGSMTCYVTLKNSGQAKATNVQVEVRPYLGVQTGDIDGGRTKYAMIDKTSPLGNISTWVSFPDLAPGESSAQSVIFFQQGSTPTGTNPNPEIDFHSATTSATASSPAP